MWYRYIYAGFDPSPYNYDGLKNWDRTLADNLSNAQGNQMPQYTFDLSNDPNAPKHYFTSDLHFGDAMKLSRDQKIKPPKNGRPLTPDEHLAYSDQHQINQWNSVVRPQDHVWVVGDMHALRSENDARQLQQKLNGTIHLIQGGHDLMGTFPMPNYPALKSRSTFNQKVFQDFVPHALLNFNKPDGTTQKVYLRHNHDLYDWDKSEALWPHKEEGAMFLYGHTHGHHDDRPQEKSLDVGGPIYNYKPLSLDNIQNLMYQKQPTRQRIPSEQFGSGMTNLEARRRGITKQHQKNMWNLNFMGQQPTPSYPSDAAPVDVPQDAPSASLEQPVL